MKYRAALRRRLGMLRRRLTPGHPDFRAGIVSQFNHWGFKRQFVLAGSGHLIYLHGKGLQADAVL